MFYHLKIIHTEEVTGDIIIIPTVEIEDYNVKIDGKIFFDQPVKKWSKNIRYHSRNCNWPRRWLQNCLSTGLCLFEKLLQDDRNKKWIQNDIEVTLNL